jgi:hypothetical protein
MIIISSIIGCSTSQQRDHDLDRQDQHQILLMALGSDEQQDRPGVSAARVGTVDKFQGQEAAAVLISMATSSAEDLPRDISFLFSRNRLNVAISRARVLAVIVASPRLLEVPCGTIEQMRLVNGFCWASAYAGA